MQTLTLLAKPSSHLGTLHCKALGSFEASLGKTGLTRVKQEGDLATPIGSFALPSAFGLLEKPITKLPYRKITTQTLCIDDPSSSCYNQIIEKDQVLCDWNSCEHMVSYDPEYCYGLVMDSPFGSCLFIHVWKSKQSPTAGCIAVSKEALLKILAWLDPIQNPTLIVDFEN